MKLAQLDIPVVLLDRLVVGSKILEIGTVGKIISKGWASSWDGGTITDEKLHLVRFENMDPAIGGVQTWLLSNMIVSIKGARK